MTLEALIEAASHTALKATDVERIATALGATASDLCDRFARRIAEGYTSGEYDFQLCDAAMTALFGYAQVDTSVGLSPFAWGVYEAFDQGEFRGEEVTRSLIATVLTRGFLMRGDT